MPVMELGVEVSSKFGVVTRIRGNPVFKPDSW